ncbi:hypothetical protein CAEBREN_18889 [Caenorhabditis brenneri]|uniref:Uncharacterized protein n=1 Tax=Caenorhabditis brenneri TaxID=135651 RepID=G0P809_CAEBE|nr:hypothetical protein CAEBREN_18889 [Caenorhabditis brenneri]
MAIFIFDGTSVIYVSTVVALVALNSRISSKKAVTLRETQLDAVQRLRSENQARLTDCISLQFRQSSHECCTLSDMYRTCSEQFPIA